MKIREDFVSNSSSSSFVLWGKAYDKYKLAEKLRDPVISSEDAESFDIYEWFDQHNQFDYDEYIVSDDEVVVGISPSKMAENETLGEFKQHVFDKIKNAGLPIDDVREITFIKGVETDGYITVD